MHIKSCWSILSIFDDKYYMTKIGNSQVEIWEYFCVLNLWFRNLTLYPLTSISVAGIICVEVFETACVGRLRMELHALYWLEGYPNDFGDKKTDKKIVMDSSIDSIPKAYSEQSGSVTTEGIEAAMQYLTIAYKRKDI